MIFILSGSIHLYGTDTTVGVGDISDVVCLHDHDRGVNNTTTIMAASDRVELEANNIRRNLFDIRFTPAYTLDILFPGHENL